MRISHPLTPHPFISLPDYDQGSLVPSLELFQFLLQRWRLQAALQGGDDSEVDDERDDKR